MASSNWKAARGLNANTHLVAVPAIYAFTVDATHGKRLDFGNFTRSVQILAVDGDVYMALNETALDGDGANRWTISEGVAFAETMQVPALYLKSTSGTVAVQVLVVLSDTTVPPDFGELTTANGFDGAGASAAVEALS